MFAESSYTSLSLWSLGRVGLYLMAIVGVLTACAGDPEGGDGGTCALSCSKVSLADVSFTVTPLTTGNEITCLGVGEGQAAKLNAPVLAKFRIDGEFDGQTIPRANIAFDPVITGATAADETNPENATVSQVDGRTVVSPVRFSGVVTPRSEWCTDACGVATVEVWPICIGGATNTVSVGISSGGMSTPNPISFPISTSE